MTHVLVSAEAFRRETRWRRLPVSNKPTCAHSSGHEPCPAFTPTVNTSSVRCQRAIIWPLYSDRNTCVSSWRQQARLCHGAQSVAGAHSYYWPGKQGTGIATYGSLDYHCGLPHVKNGTHARVSSKCFAHYAHKCVWHHSRRRTPTSQVQQRLANTRPAAEARLRTRQLRVAAVDVPVHTYGAA